MTKKHFIELANYLKHLYISEDGTTVNWEAFIKALGDFCEAQNPNFNRTRWTNCLDGKGGPNGESIHKKR